MKQEFEMSQEEMDDIIAINKNKMPVMKIGNTVTGIDLREKINQYWEKLGNKYGFVPETVEPSSKGKLFFLAEVKKQIAPKSQSDIEIAKYVDEEAVSNCKYQVRTSLKKIIDQLEMCNYECNGGCLNKNIAFIALKKLAGLDI